MEWIAKNPLRVDEKYSKDPGYMEENVLSNCLRKCGVTVTDLIKDNVQYIENS